MSKKTYYMQLKQDHKILNYLTHFQKDFLIYDKKVLRKYKGDFILGVRESGTNLLKLDTMVKNIREDPREGIIWRRSFNVWIKRANKRFYYGSKGKVKQIKTEEMLDLIFLRYIRKAKQR